MIFDNSTRAFRAMRKWRTSALGRKALRQLAQARDVTNAQMALAWLAE
jgi:aryl-alcohol dehydrogenase-like predicted oxidoreductase